MNSNNLKLLLNRRNKVTHTPIKRVYNVSITRLPSEKLNIKNISSPQVMPNGVDLRSKFPPVFDQGNLGSCTANALCGVVAYDNPKLIGSRLFLYYNERRLENDIPDDSGALLIDGIKCLVNYGICPETTWPYYISKFAVKPPQTCYNDALKHKALIVHNINNDLASMKNALISGCPFVVGILVYESFESASVASTGNVPMPNVNKEQLLGGHAIVCVGYDDTKKHWIMRNSWGSSWGVNGYFYLPYAYLLDSNLTSDLWTINKVQL